MSEQQLALHMKDRGQQLAIQKAGQEWRETSICWLKIFLATIQKNCGEKVEFTFEEFRLFCNMNELPEPESLNAWGALPKIASKRGLCRWSGRVKCATRKASHGRMIKVWEAV